MISRLHYKREESSSEKRKIIPHVIMKIWEETEGINMWINLNSYRLYEKNNMLWGLIYLNFIYSIKHAETKCIHTHPHRGNTQTQSVLRSYHHLESSKKYIFITV